MPCRFRLTTVVAAVGFAICAMVAMPEASAAPAPAAEAAWEMRVSDDGAVAVLVRGTPVVTAKYVFWGPNWQWAGVKTTVEADADGGTRITGKVDVLGLAWDGRVTSPAPNQLVYALDLTAAAEKQGIVGGGLEFNLAIAGAAFAAPPGEPVLIDGNRGLRWPVAEGQTVSVEFDPPLASVYFERGNKGQVRAMLVGTDLEAGTRRVQMKVTLPEGGRVARSMAERYGRPDTAAWFKDALAWDASPVDLSFLSAADKPAGKRGFVKAVGDRLVYADGTPARFWGGNIAAYSIFTDKETIAAQARRIARLGYNLMRIHHHDSTKWVGRTVIDKKAADSQQFDDEVMDRLDWWIKCLRDEGVYVWLDLHVGRIFKEADDLGEGAAEILARGGEGKGYCYFNPRLTALMQAFNEKYLRHKNRYTGLAYKDDPAVMGLLITNENDLTHHFGNMMLGDKGNPVHNRIFMEQVKAFCAKTGLPPDEAWKTWLPGPAKIALNEFEHRWNVRMLEHLMTLGVRVPVATTNYWGNDGLHSLPALADSGIVDVHSYGDEEALGANPRTTANYVAWMAPGQLAGRPVAITEWNVPWPARDRCTAPLYVAAASALQGWDAPMIYNYSQAVFQKPTRPDTWSTYYDPAITGIMPAAAVLFRRGDVSPAKETVCLSLDRDATYGKGLDPGKSAAIRTLVEQHRLVLALPDVPELDWDGRVPPPAGARVVTDPAEDFIPAGATRVVSDTGEVARDWARGIQTIDTPRTQAVSGWMDGGRTALSAVAFDIRVPKAAVAVTSLDGKPISASRRMLISAVARAVECPGRDGAYLSEPVAGTLVVKSGVAGLKLVPLAPDGSPQEAVALKPEQGAYTVALPTDRGTHWFLLTAE